MSLMYVDLFILDLFVFFFFFSYALLHAYNVYRRAVKGTRVEPNKQTMH